MVLEGKLIKILDDKRVIVNLGYKDGVKKNMKFFIYSEGETIKDPETGKILGKREIVKHRIKVKHIQKNITIMESDEYYKTRFDLLFAQNTFYRQSNFRLEENVKKDEEDLIVRVNDKVREDVS